MKLPVRYVLEQIVDAVNDGIAVMDCKSPEWRIEWFNAAFAEITALSAGALASQSGRELIARLGGGVSLNRLRDALAAKQPLELTLLASRPASAECALRLSGRPLLNRDQTASDRYVLYLRPVDVLAQGSAEAALQSDLAEARRRIADMSDDPVTGLASESRFRQVLQRDWALAMRESYGISLIALTMDGFQEYLDTFGDHATDSCLRMLARTVRRRLRRASDFAGRLGRDTIVILVHGGSAAHVREFAGKLAEDIGALHIHHPRSPVARYVTVSARSRSIQPSAEADPREAVESLLEQHPNTAPALLNRA